MRGKSYSHDEAKKGAVCFFTCVACCQRFLLLRWLPSLVLQLEYKGSPSMKLSEVLPREGLTCPISTRPSEHCSGLKLAWPSGFLESGVDSKKGSGSSEPFLQAIAGAWAQLDRGPWTMTFQESHSACWKTKEYEG